MLEQTLVALAAVPLGGRLYPEVAPDNPVCPYGVYSEIASPSSNTLSDGRPINQSLIQIDIWDKTAAGRAAAGNALTEKIDAAFDNGTLQGVQHARKSRYDPDAKLYGYIYEYSFWY